LSSVSLLLRSLFCKDYVNIYAFLILKTTAYFPHWF